MASSNDYDPLHDNAPSNIIRIPFDIEKISTTTYQFEDGYTNDDSVSNGIRAPDTSL